ncbi:MULTISPECIES: hypothetical protein [unclassified Coleofasciculus]|uniref:hypothetical protein n=1 Tax=unclassified Coleofasciculus TaxID=2692782 RepID=UPI0018819D28|nr:MULTISPECIES: hypothetical protein [unclassified Coleofasciculus]MBE9127051.1 hypothetical protein [Coleofasciculus sp. LEGE 07081]MBE9147270.1 hypothetical protein [Coleofasciculus sp. LEGE 07092]
MKDPIILRHKHTLSPITAIYWKDLLYRVSKIGTELEVACPKGLECSIFEEVVRQDLEPSHDFERLGTYGVMDVIPEHCGIEIRVIGRQPYFRILQQQYSQIIDRLEARDARLKATCGLHFHLLTPGLAEPVPEIILANLWNLIRRYAPELKFITSGGDKREALCRRRNHNSHLEMVHHSPGMTSMAEIQKLLKQSHRVPEHQNFLNLEHLSFTETGNVLPFHLEFRFPDADFSPTSITAKTFLFLAMLLKAVDLSQYGVIHVGKISSWRRKIKLLNMISNNKGNLANSDTSAVTDEIIEELRQGAYELLDLLAPTFSRFTDNPALDVLTALTEQPISLLRCAGYSWDEIETLLASRAALDEVGLDETDRRLMQCIELGEWANLSSVDAWRWYAARELYLTPQNLELRLERLAALRGIRWDIRQGAMVFTS